MISDAQLPDVGLFTQHAAVAAVNRHTRQLLTSYTIS